MFMAENVCRPVGEQKAGEQVLLSVVCGTGLIGLTAYSNSHLLTRKWRVDGISDHIAVYVQPANSQTVLNFYFVLLSKDF